MATTINGDTGIDKVVDDTITTADIQDGAITAAKIASGAIPNSYAGTKNRIINGNMAIDQRNAGASVSTSAGAFYYTLDRWAYYAGAASKFTLQQSTTVPSNYKNSIVITSSSAYSVAAGDIFVIEQPIEGSNVADLGWGTVDAKTVTLSFWVRSSLTGTFGGSIINSAFNRSYPFTYTISSADTWEYKTITIAGDTSGTWLTTNGVGLYLTVGLGVGSTYSGTAGAWAGAQYWSATGATSVVGTSGATFYITGVQLEVGTTATDFENLQYGQQLALCQRYYEKSYNYATALGTATLSNAIQTGGTRGGDTTLHIVDHVTYLVQKRAGATVSLWDPAGNAGKVTRDRYGEASYPNTTPYIQGAGENRFIVYSTGGSAQSMSFHYQAVAEL